MFGASAWRCFAEQVAFLWRWRESILAELEGAVKSGRPLSGARRLVRLRRRADFGIVRRLILRTLRLRLGNTGSGACVSRVSGVAASVAEAASGLQKFHGVNVTILPSIPLSSPEAVWHGCELARDRFYPDESSSYT